MHSQPSAPDVQPELKRWQAQVGERNRNPCPARPYAAAGILCGRRPQGSVISLRDVLIVVCHDASRDGGRNPWLRLAGYGACRMEGGISWGGAENCRFDKDFSLEPQPRWMSRRVDLGNARLISLGLQLDAMIDRACVNIAKADRLRMPPLWAGFRLADADSIVGDGPEFDGARHRYGVSPTELMHSARREHQDLMLYPLDWVSHVVEQAVTVFVDLHSFGRRQVFRLENPADDLVGFRGACQFDLLNSRFADRGRSRTPALSAS